MAEEGLSIREVAQRTGITTHTLRYYERIGLVHHVPRAPSGHRRYREADLQWLELLKRLHATGMPIRRMLEYARLARNGDSTIPARRALLDAHRLDVEAKLTHLQSTLGLIRKKLKLYDRYLSRTELTALRDSGGVASRRTRSAHRPALRSDAAAIAAATR
jgi:DNA-binding transcriptional MerR regulator